MFRRKPLAAKTSRSDLQVEQERLANAYKAFGPRATRVYRQFMDILREVGIQSGSILEIGGRNNPIRDRLDLTRFAYTAVDLKKTADFVVVADITNCPQIPDNSYDAVYSVDVFEHINRPWLAAAEIARILKPGGVAYTSTLFSWRYHPCPIDYWRFTPECLKFLFSDLTPIAYGFDASERRRNILGKGKSKMEPDAFGGWRENWRVYYAGRKES
jgi:SAM-dependent methyltransferase